MRCGSSQEIGEHKGKDQGLPSSLRIFLAAVYRTAGNFRGGLIFADFVGGLQNTNNKPKNQWA